MTAAGAASALQAVGLVVGTRTYQIDRTCTNIGRVLRQTPAPGTEVAPGSGVNITLAIRGPIACP